MILCASSSNTSTNSRPDDLALGFRIGHAFQSTEETGFGIDSDDLHAKILGEDLHDLIAFMMAQQAVVDEHAGQLVADRLVQHRGDHRGIDTAGQAEEHAAVADLGADLVDRVVNDVVRRPGIAAAADFVDEARVDARALRGVGDFRMELQTVVAALFVGDAGDRHVAGAGNQLEAGRNFDHAVAVAPSRRRAGHGLLR